MRTLVAVLALAVAAPAVRAEIKPHPLVSDGMVLQRGVGCTLWGSATEEEKVTWKLTQPNKDLEGSALADKGHWTIHLPVIKEAGGPFTLTLKGKNTITIKDVYVGEVWLASGQSNMEWTMTQIAGPQRARKETEADDDIKNSKNPNVRMFTVTKVTSYSPRDSVIGRWSEAGPTTTGGFSAVAYYFARELS